MSLPIGFHSVEDNGFRIRTKYSRIYGKRQIAVYEDTFRVFAFPKPNGQRWVIDQCCSGSDEDSVFFSTPFVDQLLTGIITDPSLFVFFWGKFAILGLSPFKNNIRALLLYTGKKTSVNILTFFLQ